MCRIVLKIGTDDLPCIISGLIFYFFEKRISLRYCGVNPIIILLKDFIEGKLGNPGIEVIWRRETTFVGTNVYVCRIELEIGTDDLPCLGTNFLFFRNMHFSLILGILPAYHFWQFWKYIVFREKYVVIRCCLEIMLQNSNCLFKWLFKKGNLVHFQETNFYLKKKCIAAISKKKMLHWYILVIIICLVLWPHYYILLLYIIICVRKFVVWQNEGLPGQKTKNSGSWRSNTVCHSVLWVLLTFTGLVSSTPIVKIKS